jgi:hypothetical protein
VRLHAFLTGALIVTAIPLSAGAQLMEANRQPTAGAEQTTPALDSCPPGWVWESAGYLKQGKWRPAHCAPRNLRY